jgi:hypothetical protein
MPIWGIHINPLSRLVFAPAIDWLRILLYLTDYPPQQRRISSVAVAAKLAGQGNDGSGQRVFALPDYERTAAPPPQLHQRETMALWRWSPEPKVPGSTCMLHQRKPIVTGTICVEIRPPWGE